VLADQIDHHRHARVRERSRRMRLDRDAGRVEGPGLSELAVDRLRVEAAARRAEEARVGFEARSATR
jgi:hypothetical protein